jgi:hypothetical protein
MCTVLSGFTVRDMRQYFQRHGSGGLYVRDNPEAADLWMKELELQSSCPDDIQVLALVRKMCQVDASERPDATAVVSEILDFEGNLYYGFCCDRNNDTQRSGCDGDTTTYEFTTLSSIPETEAPPASSKEPEERPSNYHPPSVEEATEFVFVKASTEKIAESPTTEIQSPVLAATTPLIANVSNAKPDTEVGDAAAVATHLESSSGNQQLRPWNR